MRDEEVGLRHARTRIGLDESSGKRWHLTLFFFFYNYSATFFVRAARTMEGVRAFFFLFFTIVRAFFYFFWGHVLFCVHDYFRVAK